MRALLMSQFWQNLQTEVATGGAERQHGRAGQEMIERLFLDGSTAKPVDFP